MKTDMTVSAAIREMEATIRLVMGFVGYKITDAMFQTMGAGRDAALDGKRSEALGYIQSVTKDMKARLVGFIRKFPEFFGRQFAAVGDGADADIAERLEHQLEKIKMVVHAASLDFEAAAAVQAEAMALIEWAKAESELREKARGQGVADEISALIEMARGRVVPGNTTVN